MNAVDIKTPITGKHKCDRCGAQAKVRATLVNGELYFCGHHGREFNSSLTVKALKVYDPEGVLNYGR